MESLLLDIEEAAASLRIRRSLLYILLSRGDLRAVKIGRRRMVPRAELEEYVRRLQEGQRVSAGAPERQA